MSDPIWRPDEAALAHARATAFMREHGIADWWQLERRSSDDIEWFWDAVVRHLDIEFAQPYQQVLDSSAGIEWSRWFTGGRMNLAATCVDRPARLWPDRTAVVWESESGEVRSLDYAGLRTQVDRIAGALRELGVGRGD